MIGYGGFGHFLFNAWRSLEEVQVVAIADIDPHVKIPERCTFFRDWRELVHDEQIDMVVVVTPPATHHDIACAALNSGKHVFVEKPIATNMKDAEAIRDVALKNDKMVIVDFMMRYNPIIETLIRLNKLQVLGRFRRFAVENYAQDELLHRDHWFWNKEVSGGVLIEHAVHFIDIVHAFTDSKMAEVNGVKSSTHEARENQVLANVLYEDGLIATHYHAFTRPGFFEQTTMRFVFDLATVEISGWIPLQGKIICIVPKRDRDHLLLLPDFQVNYIREIDDVIDVSRPEGWGKIETNQGAKSERSVVSGGQRYDIDLMIEAEFRLNLSKAEVYSMCVRGVMKDFVKSILDKSSSSRINIDDGLRSLEVAVCATDYIREV